MVSDDMFIALISKPRASAKLINSNSVTTCFVTWFKTLFHILPLFGLIYARRSHMCVNHIYFHTSKCDICSPPKINKNVLNQNRIQIVVDKTLTRDILVFYERKTTHCDLINLQLFISVSIQKYCKSFWQMLYEYKMYPMIQSFL